MIYKDEQFYKPKEGKDKVFTKKNIIFLDIDGVLQPTYNKRRFDHDLEKMAQYLYEKYNDHIYLEIDKYDLGAVYYDWSFIAIGALREIIENTHSYIVIHSSWIYGLTLNELKALFRLYDLDSFIIDIAYSKHINKIDAIHDYLALHQDIDNYVVIDDDRYLLAAFGEHCCLTEEFLDADNASLCEYILNLDSYIIEHNEDISQIILKEKWSDGTYYDALKMSYKLIQSTDVCLYYISRYDRKYEYYLLLYHAFGYFYNEGIRGMISDYQNFLESHIRCRIINRVGESLIVMSLFYGFNGFLKDYGEDRLISELDILKKRQ